MSKTTRRMRGLGLESAAGPDQMGPLIEPNG